MPRQITKNFKETWAAWQCQSLLMATRLVNGHFEPLKSGVGLEITEIKI